MVRFTLTAQENFLDWWVRGSFIGPVVIGVYMGDAPAQFAGRGLLFLAPPRDLALPQVPHALPFCFVEGHAKFVAVVLLLP
jgi:hypothetical protein